MCLFFYQFVHFLLFLNKMFNMKSHLITCYPVKSQIFSFSLFAMMKHENYTDDKKTREMWNIN